jgi:hypothetical protein
MKKFAVLLALALLAGCASSPTPLTCPAEKPLDPGCFKAWVPYQVQTEGGPMWVLREAQVCGPQEPAKEQGGAPRQAPKKANPLGSA